MITPLLEQLLQSVAPVSFVLAESRLDEIIRDLQRELHANPDNPGLWDRYRAMLIRSDPTISKAWRGVEAAYSKIKPMIDQQIASIGTIGYMPGGPLHGLTRDPSLGKTVGKGIHKFQKRAVKLYSNMQVKIDMLFDQLLSVPNMVLGVDKIEEVISETHTKVRDLFQKLKQSIKKTSPTIYRRVSQVWDTLELTDTRNEGRRWGSRLNLWLPAPRNLGNSLWVIRRLAKTARRFDVATGSDYSPESVKLLDDIVSSMSAAIEAIHTAAAVFPYYQNIAALFERPLTLIRNSIAKRRVSFKEIRELHILLHRNLAVMEREPDAHHLYPPNLIRDLRGHINEIEALLVRLLEVAARRGARL